MNHAKLVAVIGKAWGGGEDLRKALSAATRSNCWSRAVDDADMLRHNWECTTQWGTKYSVLFKNTPAEGVVDVCGWSLKMADIREMFETGDGELAVEEPRSGYGYPCEHGCEECGAPGSTCRATLETDGTGKLRLLVTTEEMCGCMSSQPVDASGGDFTFLVAPHLDAKKPSASKAKGKPKGKPAKGKK